MSWEGTLRKRRGLGDGMPNSVGIGKIQYTLGILKKVKWMVCKRLVDLLTILLICYRNYLL